jgi:iron complex outermembrane receptor protein
MTRYKLMLYGAAATLASMAAQTGAAYAQAPKATELEEVLVTATKQVGVHDQDVPLTITALGAKQMQELQLSDFGSLNHVAPNVQLSQSSSVRGTINFSIRGLGTASSVVSSDPQVGVFVDGVYVPYTVGGNTDQFDLEAIEILRGPQGVLFGKNVSGGAVVLRTTAPTDHLHVDSGVSLESGPYYKAYAIISGPVTDHISVKVAGYSSVDEGYFTDIGPNSSGKAGGGRTWVGRAAVRYTPTDALEVIGRYEHGQYNSDQEGGHQSTALFEQGVLGKFDIESAGASFTHSSRDNVTIEGNLHVPFGRGLITSILGWRAYDFNTSLNSGATKEGLLVAGTLLHQSQWSEELRYSGTFGDVDVTSGLYYFTQQFNSAIKRRVLLGPVQTAGGVLHQQTLGAFVAADWHLTEALTLNLGGRYSSERKGVRTAALGVNVCDPNSVFTSTLVCNFDQAGAKTWNAFIPKVGFQWRPQPNAQVYGSWTVGYRSGGYNVVRTVRGGQTTPYDQEKNNALEAGIKIDLADRHVRLNAAVFRMDVKNLQRDVTRPDPIIGVSQQTSNVADAIFQGVEVETTVIVAEGLSVNGHLGIIDAHFVKVIGDLNQDGVVNFNDLQQDVVRVPPLSWHIGLNYEHAIGNIGEGAFRVNYGYIDPQYWNDNNSLGRLTHQKMLDGSVELTTFSQRVTFTVYGRNLLNERMTDVQTRFPVAVGGDVAYIEKGRVFGASLNYKY